MSTEKLLPSMKAIQVSEYNHPYALNDVSTPGILQPYDLLVKVAVASFCHTDMMVQAGAFGTKLPVTASHEGAGTVVAVGDSVKNLKPGDRVMCGLALGQCDTCDHCKGPEEYKQYCQKREGGIGITLNGAFAEYVRCDSRASTLLPNTVSFLSAAPLACAGRTVWRGILLTGLEEGSNKWIALVGSGGGLGHIGIQFARALGLRVIAVDARDAGLELSRSYGADIVLDARKRKDEVVKQVRSLTGGGADGTVNISDHATAAGLACAVTRMHGTVVQIAQPANVEVPFPEIIFRDIRIRGSLICSPGESERMLETIAKHGISVKTNVFHGLGKIGELTKLVHSGQLQGKAVIVVDPEQIEKGKDIGAKL